ncbi:MAG: nucleoside monophosphate kinase [Candidatus Daviesbacteria bacterium]|nr:nucleoside monophosphate kinase [Candidatus Daviesbacteria bacterium]
MRILITGKAGSGKTTQAKILAKKLSLCFIGAGEIFRNKSLEENQIGKTLKKDLEKGILIDNKIASELIKEKVQNSSCPFGYIFDGYPRDLDQLQYFDPQFDKVIVLEVSDETLTERLTKRGRFDDTEEAINKRLEIFQTETSAVINHYQNLGIVLKIDGEKSEEEVSEEIEEKINE